MEGIYLAMMGFCRTCYWYQDDKSKCKNKAVFLRYNTVVCPDEKHDCWESPTTVLYGLGQKSKQTRLL